MRKDITIDLEKFCLWYQDQEDILPRIFVKGTLQDPQPLNHGPIVKSYTVSYLESWHWVQLVIEQTL